MVVETRLYDVLGVAPDASDAEIKKAYKRQSLANHPDKNPGDESASTRFQEISAAYETLSDPDARASYDEFGESGGPQGMPGMDMDDILASMFGGGGFAFGGGGPRRPRRAEDSVIPYKVTLEDLYNGRVAHFALEKNVVCQHCQGSGGKPGTSPKDCVTCGGKGRVLEQRQAGSGMIHQSIAECSQCHGEGKKYREKDCCKKCKGQRTVSAKAKLRLDIPKGGYDGQKLVFEGQGDQLPNTQPASIIFELKQKPHPSFQVFGLDLLTTVQLTLSEALLGFSRTVVTHLDGRHIHVSKARGDVVRPGQLELVKGEGMMDQRYQDRRGDLYIKWEVEFPSGDWAKSVDADALLALIPPKRAGMPEDAETVTDEVRTQTADINNLGSNKGTRVDAGPNLFGEDDEDGPNVQCAQQ